MPVNRTCVGCGRVFRVPPSLASRQWCSAACRYRTPGWAAALYPPRRKTCVCQVCGAEFSASKSRVGRYCSRKCLGVANGRRMSLTYQPDKRGRFTCAECGKTYLNWLSLAGRTRFCSHTCRILWHNHRRRVLRPTGIERALRAALLARGIDATPEYRVGRFSIDLALPERKIAIEADGAYWHRQPKQQRADVRKAAYLAAQGWTLLRFTEAEINTDARVCAALVAALL